MPTFFEPAPEVERIGKKMVERYHPDLRGVRIEYVFRSKASMRHNRVVGGTAKKVTGVNALLATPGAQSSEDLAFFLVTIAKNIWETLDSQKKEALVDHELEHCRVELDEDGDTHLTMRGHDIEEFSSIVGRHGLWSDDLEWFVTSLPAEQLELAAGAADLQMTISHTTADGTTRSVETTTGEMSRAAQMLRTGSGVLGRQRAEALIAEDDDPGQSTPGDA